MTLSRSIILGGILLSSLIIANAQGTFQNLDFESGSLVLIPGDFNHRYYFADAFPGWTGYAGADQISAISYNDFPLAAASISLLSIDGGLGDNVIAGRFTPLIHAGAQSGSFVEASIAQVGTLPKDAAFLDFKAQTGSLGLLASFAGQNLTLSAIDSGVNYTLYQADISAFAGQLGELRFTAPTSPINPYNGFFLDSITFLPVPEPSTLVLFAAAGVLGCFILPRRGS